MDIKNHIGPVMIDLEGTELTQEEIELINHPLVGGIIYFARNFESAEQIAALTKSIHENTTQRILTCVDQEGGRVQRFKEGFTRLPPLRPLGHTYDKSAEEGMALSKAMGWLMASEVSAVGVDFSFAPVLDLDYGESEVIGDRAFHSDPDTVSQLARAYIQGLDEAGMSSVGKHFPGHGAVKADSHLELPIDDRSTVEIMEKDVVPFAELISMNILQGIMPAHVVYTAQDKQPAGFSKTWIGQVLRQRLGFTGAVFSDDLNMAAAGMAGSFIDRANIALNAGCDMVLVCNNREGAVEVLDKLDWVQEQKSVERLQAMRGRKTVSFDELKKSEKWKIAVGAAGDLSAQ
ncbi:MAG: beta-N-acetylhexosaminidase [Gammaproteobacteria bacterium]|nr:beta-N-acetylhexosaminidase [Gammaproteobacteria bacterium]